jgi:dipeptidyl aminopeptidase/acylaminoacyl peptidase
MKKRFIVLLLPFLLASTFFVAQTAGQNPSADVVVANENLIVDSIPPIPSAISDKASRYTEFRSAGILDWHPAKREMLITTRFADVPQIHRVAMPGGARTQLTFFPDRTSPASYQPHKGDYFIFGKDIGGGEWFQIFRYDVASGDITMLTDGKSRNLGPVWSNAGDRIVYTSTRRNRADLDFYIMNPADKATDKLLVENQGGGWDIADWSPDDKTLLISNGISVNESYLYTMDVPTGARTELTPKSADKVAWSPVGFSRDGKGIYVTTDKDNEFQRLAYMDLATKKLTYLTNYQWDVDGARLSWDRKMIAFVLNENGMSTLHVLDLATNKERTLPKLPVGVIGAAQWHENNRDLAFTLSSAHSPSDVYSIELTTNKLDRWTVSETAGLNANTFVEPQLIKWKGFNGKEISGWLYQPDAKKFPGKRPVIVDIHGGPEGQSRPGFMGRNNYYINELGVAMIFPNIRGSLGYGKSFSMMDNGLKRGDSYKDIEELLKWTKLQPALNGDKVLITGGSYGGHMTLAIATHYNNMICCSVDVVGMSNLVTFLEHTEAYRRDLRRVEYGDERDPKMREYLESIAPMNKVKNITKPMFVVQGANDPRVPISEADQMVKALKANGTPVWYLVGKNEGHGFGKKKNADFQFYSTILFIRTHLLGETAPQAATGAK